MIRDASIGNKNTKEFSPLISNSTSREKVAFDSYQSLKEKMAQSKAEKHTLKNMLNRMKTSQLKEMIEKFAPISKTSSDCIPHKKEVSFAHTTTAANSTRTTKNQGQDNHNIIKEQDLKTVKSKEDAISYLRQLAAKDPSTPKNSVLNNHIKRNLRKTKVQPLPLEPRASEHQQRVEYNGYLFGNGMLATCCSSNQFPAALDMSLFYL